MARSIEEIQNEIISFKDAQPELSGLSSTSRTAIWRLWTYVIATAIHFHERIYDTFISDVQTLISENPVGTPGWYVFQLYRFQEGSILQIVDGRVEYPFIDESKRIIARAAYEQVEDILVLKAAKDIGGSIVPLDANQRSQVIGYLDKKRFAGTKIEFRSVNPDEVRVDADIYANPELNKNTLQLVIIEALKAYIEFIDFGGLLYISKVEDAIQSVEGVVDVQINTVNVVTSAGQIVDVNRYRRLYAGYAVYVQPDSEYTLNIQNAIS